METRFYNNPGLNITRLASSLENIYRSQGYQTQQIGDKEQLMVQLRKGGEFEAILGMQAALSLTFQRNEQGITVIVGQQKWVDKAAVGVVGLAVPTLWPLLVTAGIGAFRQANLANQVLTILDGLVQQQPNTPTGSTPTQS